MRTLCTIVALVLLTGCGYDPYGHLFTTTQPKKDDVPGAYLLTRETISTVGPRIYELRQCQLDLQPDGTFSITNYPTWSEAYSRTSRQFVAFISTTGRWSCKTIGGVNDGTNHQNIWGVRFADAEEKVHQMGLTGQAAPYGLMMTYGDPDSGRIMMFTRKK